MPQPLRLCVWQQLIQKQMKFLKTPSVTLLASFLTFAATAQNAGSFMEFMSSLPQPPATLQVALERQPVTAETVMAAAATTVTKGKVEAYRPLYACFLRNFSGGHAALSSYSAVERKLYSDHEIGARGLSEDNRYVQFLIIIENRPFFGSGLLSWGLPAKFSGAEKEFYLQAISLEKMFDNSLMKPSPQKLLENIFTGDPVLDAVHEKFNKDLAALPRRQVKTADGFIIEVEDPVKAIAAYKTYGRQRQEHFERLYATAFATRQLQYKLLLAIAEKLDALAMHPSANTPAAAVLLSDLKGRTWDVAKQLFTATDRLWQDLFIAQMGQKQVEEAVELYTAYKANIH